MKLIRTIALVCAVALTGAFAVNAQTSEKKCEQQKKECCVDKAKATKSCCAQVKTQKCEGAAKSCCAQVKTQKCEGAAKSCCAQAKAKKCEGAAKSCCTQAKAKKCEGAAKSCCTQAKKNDKSK